MKKIFYLILIFPEYVQMQIWLRTSNSESAKRWKEWQPTLKQSLSEYVEYSLDVCRIPTIAIAWRMWALIIMIPILCILIASR